MQYAMSPTHAGSSASDSIRVERLGQVALRLDGYESSFHLNAFRGAMPKQHLDGDAVLAITLASGSKEVYLSMDETELSLVDWQMRQGARVVQWAKLAGNAKEGEAKRRWEDVKVQSHEFGKVRSFVIDRQTCPLIIVDLGCLHRATSSRRRSQRSLCPACNVLRESRKRDPCT
jgi:hypothetical protein